MEDNIGYARLILPKNSEKILSVENLDPYYENPNRNILKRILISKNIFSLDPVDILDPQTTPTWLDRFMYPEHFEKRDYLAKIRLIEPKVEMNLHSQVLNEGKIEIIEILDLASPEFSPERIREITRAPSSDEKLDEFPGDLPPPGEYARISKEYLSDYHHDIAKKILLLLIAQKNSEKKVMPLFTAQELAGLYTDFYNPVARIKILSYLKKTDKDAYAVIAGYNKTKKEQRLKEKKKTRDRSMMPLLEWITLFASILATGDLIFNGFPTALEAIAILMLLALIPSEISYREYEGRIQIILDLIIYVLVWTLFAFFVPSEWRRYLIPTMALLYVLLLLHILRPLLIGIVKRLLKTKK